MSEELTQNFRNNNQVLQQILSKLEVMDTRLQFVETKVTERSYDTKPIWEQALSEIMDLKHALADVQQGQVDVKQGLVEVKHEFAEVKHELVEVKQELAEVKHELAAVKHELAIVNRKIDVFNSDMLKLRAEQLRTEDRIRHLEA